MKPLNPPISQTGGGQYVPNLKTWKKSKFGKSVLVLQSQAIANLLVQDGYLQEKMMDVIVLDASQKVTARFLERISKRIMHQ